jgi:hypothetical protein
LRDFARDPVGMREGPNDVAHELRLADAAGVPANHYNAPLRYCAHFTSLPVWLPAV